VPSWVYVQAWMGFNNEMESGVLVRYEDTECRWENVHENPQEETNEREGGENIGQGKSSADDNGD